MAIFVITRRNRDNQNTGELLGRPVYSFTGSDSSQADAACGRLNRAARSLFQFKQHPPPQKLADHAVWQDAAKATLGAVDPAAIADEEYPMFDAVYFVTEVPPFVEPTEDPPANEAERILRDMRDVDPPP